MAPSSRPVAKRAPAPGLGLHDPQVSAVLERLHEEAKSDKHLFLQSIPVLLKAWLKRADLDAATKPFVSRGFFNIVPAIGELLYLTARAIDARRVVEFGTSFGISSIYLAAAMRDNDGYLVGSELQPDKAAAARRNLEDAGLAEFAEIRAGDALQTLLDLPAPVDLVFLDGWKELYVPMLELLRPKLRKGSVVVADDILFPSFTQKIMARYLRYVRDPRNGFQSTTLKLGGGIEYSVFEG